ncbi:MAG: type II secretion system protein GspK, partial [Gemmataceae bacterium]|nr:type II secretion system protein GspK [Gemmataceae bacterium]
MRLGTHTGSQRRGVVLLAVLVVVVILALAAYQYGDLMLSEYRAAVNAHRAAQARAFAESGINTAIAILSDAESLAAIHRNVYDNPGVFANIAVGDEGRGKTGRFTLIAPPDPNAALAAPFRAGVTDEGGKININALIKLDPTGEMLYNALLKLPGMTSELAACITDWVDADDQPREGGAEIDVYSSENPPYRTKNGPLDSLEELLLVRGMTPELLYGNDLNRNGFQDGDEGAGDEGFDRGLSEFLTIYSREHNTDASGQPLTYVNDTDLEALYEKLSITAGEELAKFLVMYRQYGPSNTSGQSQSLGASLGSLLGLASGKKGGSSKQPTTVRGDINAWTPDFTKKPKQRIKSFYDLVDTQVSIAGKTSKDPTVVYFSPLNDPVRRRELLPMLYHAATIYQEIELPARININTAPAAVLATIPNLSETDIQTILQMRPPLGGDIAPDPIFDTPAWLLTEAKLKVDTIKKIEPFITTRSQV